jgi:hypothetical protein
MWRAHPVLALLVAMALMTLACGDDDGSKPNAALASATLEYSSGSIPPPYNYEWTLAVRLEGAAKDVRYELKYRYRTRPQDTPPGADTDLASTGPLSAELEQRVRSAASANTFDAPPDPRKVGGDSFKVTLAYSDGTQRSGPPKDRDAWVKLAAEVDAAARRAQGRTIEPPPSLR